MKVYISALICSQQSDMRIFFQDIQEPWAIYHSVLTHTHTHTQHIHAYIHKYACVSILVKQIVPVWIYPRAGSLLRHSRPSAARFRWSHPLLCEWCWWRSLAWKSQTIFGPQRSVCECWVCIWSVCMDCEYEVCVWMCVCMVCVRGVCIWSVSLECVYGVCMECVYGCEYWVCVWIVCLHSMSVCMHWCSKLICCACTWLYTYI